MNARTDAVPTFLVPRQPTGVSEGFVDESMRMLEALRSPVFGADVACFRSGPHGGGPDATDAQVASLVDAWAGCDAHVLRLAELRPDACRAAPFAFAHHVVFAPAGAAFRRSDLVAAWAGPFLHLRGGRIPDGEVLFAEALRDAGLVDVLCDGPVADAMQDYVRRAARRRNGEIGIHAALRRTLRR